MLAPLALKGPAPDSDSEGWSDDDELQRQSLPQPLMASSASTSTTSSIIHHPSSIITTPTITPVIVFSLQVLAYRYHAGAKRYDDAITVGVAILASPPPLTIASSPSSSIILYNNQKVTISLTTLNVKGQGPILPQSPLHLTLTDDRSVVWSLKFTSQMEVLLFCSYTVSCRYSSSSSVPSSDSEPRRPCVSMDVTGACGGPKSSPAQPGNSIQIFYTIKSLLSMKDKYNIQTPDPNSAIVSVTDPKQSVIVWIEKDKSISGLSEVLKDICCNTRRFIIIPVTSSFYLFPADLKRDSDIFLDIQVISILTEKEDKIAMKQRHKNELRIDKKHLKLIEKLKLKKYNNNNVDESSIYNSNNVENDKVEERDGGGDDAEYAKEQPDQSHNVTVKKESSKSLSHQSNSQSNDQPPPSPYDIYLSNLQQVVADVVDIRIQDCLGLLRATFDKSKTQVINYQATQLSSSDDSTENRSDSIILKDEFISLLKSTLTMIAASTESKLHGPGRQQTMEIFQSLFDGLHDLKQHHLSATATNSKETTVNKNELLQLQQEIQSLTISNSNLKKELLNSVTSVTSLQNEITKNDKVSADLALKNFEYEDEIKNLKKQCQKYTMEIDELKMFEEGAAVLRQQLETAKDHVDALTQQLSDCLHLNKHSKLTWVPDELVPSCMNCHRRFSAFVWKHHCRCCGRVFCSGCVSQKTSIAIFGYRDDVPVCDSCYGLLCNGSSSSTLESGSETARSDVVIYYKTTGTNKGKIPINLDNDYNTNIGKNKGQVSNNRHAMNKSSPSMPDDDEDEEDYSDILLGRR